MNTIPVAQLQIASLVDELLSLRERFRTFDCGNVFLKSDYYCFIECRVYSVMEISHFNRAIPTLRFLSSTYVYCTF